MKMKVKYNGLIYTAREDEGFLIVDMGAYELPVLYSEVKPFLSPEEKKRIAQQSWKGGRRSPRCLPGQHIRVHKSRGDGYIRVHQKSYIPLDVRKINELGYMTR